MKKATVCICIGKENIQEIQSLTSKILALKVPNYRLTVILSVDDNFGTKHWQQISTLTKIDNRIIVNKIKIRKKRITFARSYLAAFERALKEQANVIVEMDFGAHDYRQIPLFIKKINNVDCVFSTRFSNRGKIINYPLQRRVVSKLGTILSNLFLTNKQPLSDMTSGFEAFSNKFLKKLFLLIPPDNWISCHNVAHLFQTEVRSYAIWLNVKYRVTPISYGINKKGKTLAFSYIFRSLFGLIKLFGRKRFIISFKDKFPNLYFIF